MTDADGPRALRRLPAVGRWLTEPRVAGLVARHGRSLVADAARHAIEVARREIRAGSDAPSPEALESELERIVRARAASSLVRVVNGTGVILHTNLGRAPLGEAARHAVARAAEGYSNLELDLESGRRGRRDDHIGPLAAEMCGAEAALPVNNCAGATLLMLAATCRGREVVVSRGELVEIGGGFRVPDVMAESGAHLVEVGTTNKVYVDDYARALSDRTAALLVVHRSNFAIVGFEHTPPIEDLAALARRAGVLLLVDLGSGLVSSDADLGRAAAALAREPRPSAVVAAGADVVAFSGDKLLGGPQAGLLVGRADPIGRCARHPLARALRIDKLSVAALEATLREHRAGRGGALPALRAIAEPIETVAARAEALRTALEPSFRADEAPRVVPSVARPGGGSLPTVELPSRAVVFGPVGGPADALAAKLRAARPVAIVGRAFDGRLGLDARTIADEEITLVARGIEETTGAER